jgi:hypothetical protein
LTGMCLFRHTLAESPKLFNLPSSASFNQPQNVDGLI